MRRWEIWFSSITLTLIIAAYFLVTPALAHVPTFGGGGKSPETAIPFKDPSISRVFMGSLPKEI